VTGATATGSRFRRSLSSSGTGHQPATMAAERHAGGSEPAGRWVSVTGMQSDPFDDLTAEQVAEIHAAVATLGFGVSYLACGPWAVASGRSGLFRSAALELQIKHQPPKRGAVIGGLANGVSGSGGGVV
jgi:hypothetical protein